MIGLSKVFWLENITDTSFDIVSSLSLANAFALWTDMRGGGKNMVF